MPFTEKTLMDMRFCFVSACLRAEEPMSRLGDEARQRCRRIGRQGQLIHLQGIDSEVVVVCGISLGRARTTPAL